MKYEVEFFHQNSRVSIQACSIEGLQDAMRSCHISLTLAVTNLDDDGTVANDAHGGYVSVDTYETLAERRELAIKNRLPE